MRTLLDERFAPITSSIGFLELPLEAAAGGLERWRRDLYERVRTSLPDDGFPEVLRRLEPLTSGARPRELLVAAGAWTAYLDCSLQGTDAVSAIGHLTRELRCRGLAIRVVPHTYGMRDVEKGRMGAVQFELFGPERTDFLNYVRTVAVTYDGSRWVFDARGEVQPFEEVLAYRARRVRDRFTSEMLERYCRALGVDVFDPAAYGPAAVLFESSVVMPPDGLVMTLERAQRHLGIVPGAAASLPG